jgi:hypothetical protein
MYLIRADFKLEELPPNNEILNSCECENYAIFQYITILSVSVLFIVILIGGIIIGLKIDNKFTKKNEMELQRKRMASRQLITIKAVRVISTASPRMINGRKVIRSDNSK